MSVSGASSQLVYFDPLIKLNSGVVNYIPKGLPETEKYNQFFSKGQFNSLIQRTLGNGSQKKRTLLEATQEGVVDSNIRITLDTLFHSGNPFYINGKRFTIFSYEWEKGDWKIQSVGSQKMSKALKPYASNVTGGPPRYPFYGIPGYGQIPGYGPGTAPAYAPAYAPPYAPPYPQPYPRPTGPDLPVDIEPEALSGSVESGLSKLERAAVAAGVSPAPPKTVASTSSPSPSSISKPVPIPKPIPKPKPVPAPIPKPVPPPVAPISISAQDKELHRQFLAYLNEANAKGFISSKSKGSYNAMVNNINEWRIRPNTASGDCFFEALRDSLNAYNAVERDKILDPPYMVPKLDSEGKMELDPSNKKPILVYSVSGLRRMVADYIGDPASNDIYDRLYAVAEASVIALKDDGTPIPPRIRFMLNNKNGILSKDAVAGRIALSSTPKYRNKGEAVLKDPDEYYWGDLMAVNCIESVLPIKIIMITDHSNEGGRFRNGSRVRFNDASKKPNEGTVKNYQPPVIAPPADEVYDIEDDDYTIHKSSTLASADEIDRYSIYCSDANIPVRKDRKFLFMFYTNNNHFEALYQKKYKDDKYIYPVNDIPGYILYMIFENCYRTIPDKDDRKNTGFGIIPELRTRLNQLLSLYQDNIARKAKGDKLLSDSKKMLTYGGQPSPTPPSLPSSSSSSPSSSPSPSPSPSPLPGASPKDAGDYAFAARKYALDAKTAAATASVASSSVPAAAAYAVTASDAAKRASDAADAADAAYKRASVPGVLPHAIYDAVAEARDAAAEAAKAAKEAEDAAAHAVDVAAAPTALPVAVATPMPVPAAVPMPAPRTPVVPPSAPVTKPVSRRVSSVGQRYTNTGYNSNLTYYIVIDLELYPGDSIPLPVKASLACQIRYEKIRQSYADLFGLIYQPKELQLTPTLNANYISRSSSNKTKKEAIHNSQNKTKSKYTNKERSVNKEK